MQTKNKRKCVLHDHSITHITLFSFLILSFFLSLSHCLFSVFPTAADLSAAQQAFVIMISTIKTENQTLKMKH